MRFVDYIRSNTACAFAVPMLADRPDPDASWWYPGHSYAVAFTRPGQAVRWPDWRAIHWATVPKRPFGTSWGCSAGPTLDAVAHVTTEGGAA